MQVLFWISLIGIFHSFIGYPITLFILDKIAKKKYINIDTNYTPKVSIIIPAHNEQNVILRKLENLIYLDYDRDKFEVIIASDNSTDDTNYIVNRFIENNKDRNIKLYEVKERKGKTNAQNESVKMSSGEIIVFSDANAMLDKKSIRALVKYMADETVAYVCGRLAYTNNKDSNSSSAESSYWSYDLFMRKVESNISSITAGNGAIYAVRKSEYIEFEPIRCHDGAMPQAYVVKGKRALYNEDAIAYEKAGETSGDEFKRKVRMNREILTIPYSNIQKYNPFKCGIFSYFYFSHRYLRNSLFILHIVLFISNLFVMNKSVIFMITGIGQIAFYGLALVYNIFKLNNKLIYIPYYYSMTIYAQLIGAIRQLQGKSKPIWEKAESTR